MKCIARTINGERTVVRVSDAIAQRAVASGQWHYVPKHVWKAAGRPSAGRAA